MNPHHKPYLIKLIPLDLRLKPAAVHQSRPDTKSAFFRCALFTQKHRGILLVAGHASSAAALLDAVNQRRPLCLSLLCMSAMEMNPLPVAIGNIHAQTVYSVYDHRRLSLILHNNTSCDHVLFFQHAVF